LLDKHIFQVKEDIREISEIASKEKGFEKILNKMRSEWKHIKFEIIAYKDTETFIMKAVEPILDKLDEDIARTMSIGSSPFIKFLEHEVVNWRTTLLRTQECIESWIKLQRLWQYLQPIFFSEDIIKEMQKEGTKFQSVDKQWRAMMHQTHS
jgi:dynein heavy chain